MGKNPKRRFEGLAGSPLAKTKDDLVSSFEKPIPLPSPAEAEKQERQVKRALGLNVKPEYVIKSNRRYFTPLLSVENIAAFLTLPQVLFEGYDSARHTPKYETVRTVAVPFQTTNGKHPVVNGTRIPPKLSQRLAAIKEELITTLTAKYSREHGGMLGAELTRARRLKSAERRRVEDKIAHYENGWIKIDIPGTGRPSMDIQIPSQPKGTRDCFRESNPGFMRSVVKRYVREAWGATIANQFKTDMESERNFMDPSWEHHWAEFENLAIARALQTGLFECWPRKEDRERLMVPAYRFTEVLNHEPENVAQAAAQTGYTKTALWESAAPPDGIRVNRPQGIDPRRFEGGSNED